jgi:hypothetical protein
MDLIPYLAESGGNVWKSNFEKLQLHICNFVLSALLRLILRTATFQKCGLKLPPLPAPYRILENQGVRDART